jgi:hypothetical protein
VDREEETRAAFEKIVPYDGLARLRSAQADVKDGTSNDDAPGGVSRRDNSCRSIKALGLERFRMRKRE